MTPLLPDPASAFGARVRERLQNEQVIWLTTVGRDGTPQPNPVWFLWEGESFLVYNTASAQRLRHIVDRPAVALHFNGDAAGDDVVVFRGHAARADDVPGPHENAAYVDKYAAGMTQVSGSPEAFGAAYPVPVRVEVSGVRGF